jgi:hypothetical protein
MASLADQIAEEAGLNTKFPGEFSCFELCNRRDFKDAFTKLSFLDFF